MTTTDHPEKKFIADSMLGKLAKWMRIMGYDVEYYPKIADKDLVERAFQTGRLILTRDTLLIRRKKARKNNYFIHGDRYKDQIRQVVNHFSLAPYKHILTRCLLCNTPLDTIAKKAVKDKVPIYVYQTQDSFAACPTCQRTYWGATHKDEMVRQLKEILDKGPESES